MRTQLRKPHRHSDDRTAVPAPRLFTVDEYERMAETGILRPDERVELLAGVIYAMAAMGSRHAAGVRDIDDWFHLRLGNRAIVSVQCPIRLGEFGEPEPDIAILRLRQDRYREAHPGPADVLLAIEVSDSSLSFDRGVKLPQYAAAGIPEVWIVDLNRRRVLVYREPRDGRYVQTSIVARGGALSPLAFPDLTLKLADVLA